MFDTKINLKTRGSKNKKKMNNLLFVREKVGDKMPYTKRKAHHGRIDDLLDYIMDEEKQMVAY